MSMELMVLVNKHKFDSPIQKLIFLQLADNANKDGKCWPSYQYIADTSGCGKSTVRKHLKLLEKMGFLSIKNRKGSKGNSSNYYQINKAKLTPDHVAPDSTGVYHEVAQGVAPDSTPPVAPDSTRTSNLIEPVNEPSDIEIVFDHWKKIHNHKKSVLDENRITLIRNALKKFSIDDIKLAITGCKKSKYHQGDNPEGKVYDSLGLILRNAENIERFIGYNETKQPKQSITDIKKEIFTKLSKGQHGNYQFKSSEAERVWKEASKTAILWNLNEYQINQAIQEAI